MFKTCLRRTADLTPTQSEDDMSSGSARRARVTVIRVLVMTRFRGRLTFRIMNHAEGPVRMDHPPPPRQ